MMQVALSYPLGGTFYILEFTFFICDCLWENRPYRHNNWNPFYGLTLKLHSPTVQAHQAHGYR